MEEQQIVRLGAPNRPCNDLNNIPIGGWCNEVGLLVSEDDYILRCKAVPLDGEARDFVAIVDASSQVTVLVE